MLHDRPIPKEKLLFEIGTGTVRVQIVEGAYGCPEFRFVRYRYSITGGEPVTSDLFDTALISEMACRLEQTRLFFAQRSADAGKSAVPVINHQ